MFTPKNAAVRHIFRVAASLDSMMVGEPQILGQIKSAYVTAAKNRTSGVLLNRLLHRTFSVAKKIRTETGIGDHAVSISYAAIELARKIFGSLEGKTALLIGAGEMAELAMEHLLRHKVSRFLVANRTFERAVDLAGGMSGKAIHMEEVSDALSTCDIVVSSTGAPGYVLKKDQVKAVMRKRKNRPVFFIDIAVPRDIDPAINKISNVYVYDIDDLKTVVDENIKDREKEALKAERIVEEAVIRFEQWYESMEVVPTIKALRFKAGKIAETECEKNPGGPFPFVGKRPPGRAAHVRIHCQQNPSRPHPLPEKQRLSQDPSRGHRPGPKAVQPGRGVNFGPRASYRIFLKDIICDRRCSWIVKPFFPPMKSRSRTRSPAGRPPVQTPASGCSPFWTASPTLNPSSISNGPGISPSP